MCRNPFDQFISHWKFLQNIAQEQNVQPISFEEAFELFCKGIHSFGPSSEHVLGYWKASLDNPRKILFFKYEDVKEDTSFHVNKLADFLGCPFSDVEKSRGVIEEIVKLCSFDNMKHLEVNKTGRIRGSGAKNSNFFRKGKVGDWTNYFTPSMSERMNKLMEEKFSGSDLTFKMS
ncbi:hypothetical protein LWI29_019915 [Acer saccharum]|uniref:Sulfotransferase n=1 Tax=Acer saccharum TaxID=4024 RepID=A0AA39VYE7_ACESA|nr:hypothetical protein LWI29_019915 [Acer saccharum]